MKGWGSIRDNTPYATILLRIRTLSYLKPRSWKQYYEIIIEKKRTHRQWSTNFVLQICVGCSLRIVGTLNTGIAMKIVGMDMFTFTFFAHEWEALLGCNFIKFHEEYVLNLTALNFKLWIYLKTKLKIIAILYYSMKEKPELVLYCL